MPSKKTTAKEAEDGAGSFSLRLKIGDQEIEIMGTHEEVTKTIGDLPNLIPSIQKAFETIKPKTVATLTVKTEAQPKSSSEEPAQAFPKIAATSNCEEAILRVLGTDWGKWRPRTVEELKDAMKASGLRISDKAMSETLEMLAKRGSLRRWNTNNGFVYILVEEKRARSGEER